MVKFFKKLLLKSLVVPLVLLPFFSAQRAFSMALGRLFCSVGASSNVEDSVYVVGQDSNSFKPRSIDEMGKYKKVIYPAGSYVSSDVKYTYRKFCEYRNDNKKKYIEKIKGNPNHYKIIFEFSPSKSIEFDLQFGFLADRNSFNYEAEVKIYNDIIRFVKRASFFGSFDLNIMDIKGESVVVLPKGVKKIGKYAFSCCSNLISVEIPEGVTSIEYGAFECCGKLRTVNMPSTIESIGDNVFESCIMLENLEIPQSVTSIGNTAFFLCSSLKNAILPKGIKSIGANVFLGCVSLDIESFRSYYSLFDTQMSEFK